MICDLPLHSPDFNFVEKLFSKFKAILRKAARRTRQTLWDEIGRLSIFSNPANVRTKCIRI